MRVAVLAIASLIGLIVIGAVLVPEGEVATLSTFESDGTEHETQVWVVEGNGFPGAERGQLFLRTGPRTRWLARLRSQPEVVLARGEERVAYLAVVEESPELRDHVNEAMAEKYGLSDRLLGGIYDPARAVPVRLVPDPTRQAAQEDARPH